MYSGGSTKTCGHCRLDLPIELFCRSSQFKHGRHWLCKDCNTANSRKWQKANPERFKKTVRAAHLKSAYGISPEDYEEMFQHQGGCCAICREPETAKPKGSTDPKPLAVDHDHSTGMVRQLLCSKCNHGLGLFRDRPELLREAARYLDRHDLSFSGDVSHLTLLDDTLDLR